MDIINRTGRDEGMVRTVAQHSSVAGEIFVVFLDDASAGTGHHAFAVSRRIIATQKLPRYVIEAIGA